MRQMGFTIIPTSNASHIAKQIQKRMPSSVIFCGRNKENRKQFPDGEIYIKLEQVQKLKGRVVVLHSGMPNPNTSLVELELLLQILNQNKKVKIEVFFAYFSYCMQDSVFIDGETNAAEQLIKKLIDYYNVKKIYTLDAHFYNRDWPNKYPITNVSVIDLLEKKAKKTYSNLVFVTPDKGAARRTGINGANKKRQNSFVNEFECDETFSKLVAGKNVAVVDDILETGGTLARFYDECKDCGAKKAVALITHGVLARGITRMEKTYNRLYLTNSINRKQANVDISQRVLETIRG